MNLDVLLLQFMMKYQINLYFSSTQYYGLKLVSSSFLFCRIVDLTTLEKGGSVQQPSLLFFHVFICITLLETNWYRDEFEDIFFQLKVMTTH